MNENEIVAVKDEEVEALSDICKTTFKDTFEHDMSQQDLFAYFDEAYNHKVLLDELHNQQSWYYFAKIDGEVAGYMKLNVGDAQTESMGEDYLEVQRLYMYKQFQSKGIGSKLMKQAFEIAEKEHKKKLWLGVWEHNHQALKFYTKHGYKIVGSHQFIAGDDVSTDYIVETTL
ncbi:MAG TPA: GNAT family N-acetyltransferase [Staphylococcus sp.]|nr:GNAT family N-acetyltransferase [Staphylococcus sp.]